MIQKDDFDFTDELQHRKELGRTIQKMREERNMTQMQVVEKLQLLGLPISREIYGQIECGIHLLRIPTLMGLKKVFGVSYDDILEPGKSRKNEK